MKLLLTSAGAPNPSIQAALVDLLGRPVAECTAAHIPTAMYGYEGGLGFSTEMFRAWDAMGWKELKTLELTALPSMTERLWRPELETVDAILVGGGNTAYLCYWFNHSGFAAALPSLLEKAVYVGVSAGAYVLTPALHFDADRLAREGVYFDDEYDELTPPGAGDHRGVGLVDFHLRPHLNSEDFPKITKTAMERAAAGLDAPLYAIDDQSAIKVVDGQVEVVTEGEWHRLEAGERRAVTGDEGVAR